MTVKSENIGQIVNMSQIGIDSRSTQDLIQLALAAPEEDETTQKSFGTLFPCPNIEEITKYSIDQFVG